MNCECSNSSWNVLAMTRKTDWMSCLAALTESSQWHQHRIWAQTACQHHATNLAITCDINAVATQLCKHLGHYCYTVSIPLHFTSILTVHVLANSPKHGRCLWMLFWVFSPLSDSWLKDDAIPIFMKHALGNSLSFTETQLPGSVHSNCTLDGLSVDSISHGKKLTPSSKKYAHLQTKKPR